MTTPATPTPAPGPPGTTTTDRERVLQRAAALAGHDHGWLHAESVRRHGCGGLYAEPVVPERFASVASWYVAAFDAGVIAFLVNTATD
jgi:hypothetical protein